MFITRRGCLLMLCCFFLPVVNQNFVWTRVQDLQYYGDACG